MNISIKQGLDFNKYQEKIIKQTIQKSKRKRKGNNCPNKLCHCINCTCGINCSCGKEDNQSNRSNKSNKSKKEGFDNINDVVQEYDNTLSKYKYAMKLASQEVNTTIYRESSNNPFNGTNVNLTGTGALGYVTNEGIYKWYPSMDTYNSTLGKNGCPSNTLVDINNSSSNYNYPGTSLGTSPNLYVGSTMRSFQSCGNEGSNVYVNSLINNPTIEYKGCYSLYDKPDTSIIMPIFTSSNESNGYNVSASSTYNNDNTNFGPWRAFDQNKDTYWHSLEGSGDGYDGTSGDYIGSSSVTYVPVGGTYNSALVKGENLYVECPPNQNSLLQSYTISPRRDGGLWEYRSPNSWMVLGNNDRGYWFIVDTQSNQLFSSADDIHTYNVNSTIAYNQYCIVVSKVGNNSVSSNRITLQIGEWDLYGTMQASTSSSTPSMDVLSNGTTTTYDQCSNIALQAGYKYFGLGNGTGECYGTNNYDGIIANGDATLTYDNLAIWASNTPGTDGTYLTINKSGFISVVKSDGTTIIWQSGDELEDCKNSGGSLNIDSVVATYGMNCNNSGFSITSGNVTDKTKAQLSDKNQNPGGNTPYSIAVSNSTFGDPAGGCPKGYDVSYNCGAVPMSQHLDYAEGQTFILTCAAETSKCDFFLILQDDGNLCLYRGTEPNSDTNAGKGGIWCTMTNAQQKDPNPNFVASKGKYGRNYLKSNEQLNRDEWVGSNDGSMMLMMQTDGNLVVYTFIKNEGCTTDSDNKTTGTSNNVALYQFDEGVFSGNMGKVAYIDKDATLHEYPDSMLSKTNNYYSIENVNSSGNDFNGMPLTNSNVADCTTACNNSNDCAGFVFDRRVNNCWLKNNNMYPKGSIQNLQDVDTYVRTPNVNNPISCSSDINNIDSVQYENYVKGDQMTTDFRCGENLVSDSTKSLLQTLKDQLSSLANQIVGNTNNLYDANITTTQQMSDQKKISRKDIMEYAKVQKQINFLEDTDKTEGLANISDATAMENDTSLWVSMENSEFVLWTLIALGLISVTIYLAGKRKK